MKAYDEQGRPIATWRECPGCRRIVYLLVRVDCCPDCMRAIKLALWSNSERFDFLEISDRAMELIKESTESQPVN